MFSPPRWLSTGSAAVAVLLTTSFAVTAADAASKPKPVSVFPAPGTPVVSDTTTFSFRGTRPTDLGPVKIYGSRTGKHHWSRLAHSDGRGVSVVPKGRFQPGETIRIYTRKRIKRTSHGDFRVRVGRFYGNDD